MLNSIYVLEHYMENVKNYMLLKAVIPFRRTLSRNPVALRIPIKSEDRYTWHSWEMFPSNVFDRNLKILAIDM